MRVTLFERGTIASGASDLDLALMPADVDASRYLELHHFTGGGFYLDRSLPDECAPGAVAVLLGRKRGVPRRLYETPTPEAGAERSGAGTDVSRSAGRI